MTIVLGISRLVWHINPHEETSHDRLTSRCLPKTLWSTSSSGVPIAVAGPCFKSELESTSNLDGDPGDGKMAV